MEWCMMGWLDCVWMTLGCFVWLAGRCCVCRMQAQMPALLLVLGRSVTYKAHHCSLLLPLPNRPWCCCTWGRWMGPAPWRRC